MKRGLSPAERIRLRVDKQEDGCWMWTGTRFQSGYAALFINGKTRHASRYIYEYFIAAIPPDHHLRHCQKSRACVNPWHMEVMHKRDIQKTEPKTHCIRGHEFTPENTRQSPSKNTRYCRKCDALRKRIARKEGRA